MSVTTVVLVKNGPNSQDTAEGFPYAIEVRDSLKGLIHRWTYRTYDHALRERKHVA